MGEWNGFTDRLRVADDMVVVCARCNNYRDSSEMAFINERPYCHPVLSLEMTCYMKQGIDDYAQALATDPVPEARG